MKKHEIKLVSASAGSGKTYRLVEIVCEEVEAGLSARGLIAVTYTKKAAEELKQRVREKLVDKGRIDTARSMSASRIGTVHSVCADLLKRFAFEDGSSPTQRVMDEDEATKLFNEALSQTLDSEQLSPLLGLCDRLSIPIPELIEQVNVIAGLARQNDMNEDSLRESLAISVGQIDLAFPKPVAGHTAKALAAELSRFVKDHPNPPDEKANTAKAYKCVRDLKTKLVDQDQTLPWCEWVRLTKLAPAKKVELLFNGIVEQAKTFMSSPELRRDLTDVITAAFNLAQQSMQVYAAKKQSLGALDYADLEQKALRLLDNKSVAEQLASELDVLLVDEFQDTNPVQLAIFIKLSEFCRKTVWVGDLKQSIYQFRGADPILMKSIMANLKDLKPEVLKDNWRSRSEIVELVNDLFAQAFEADGIPREQVVQKAKWAHLTDGPALEVWINNGQNEDERTTKFAQGIKDYLNSGRKIFDKETGQQREVRPGDIAILCRSNDECAALSHELHAMGIESSTSRGLLLDQPEVTLALAAYRFLMNPRDTIAAAEITIALGADSNKWLAQALEDDDVESWHPVLERLGQARSQATEMCIREKVDLAISAAGLESHFERLEAGQKRLFHLAALRQEAQSYEESCHATFSVCTDIGLLDYLSNQKPGVPSTPHPDAINITTYHGAKGLEWPVVILASLKKEPWAASLFATRVELKEGIKFNPRAPLDNRVIAYLPWPFGNFKNVDELDLKLASCKKLVSLSREALAEQRRVLYVGMTRAREHLILLNTLGKKAISESAFGVLTDKTGICVFQFGKDALMVSSKKHLCITKELDSPAEPALQKSGKGKKSAPNVIVMPQPKLGSGRFASLFLQPSKLDNVSAPALACTVECGPVTVWGDGLLLKLSGKESSKTSNRNIVGTAVHLFLGSDQQNASREKRLVHAKAVISEWGIEQQITPEDLVAASDRFAFEVKKLWPAGKIHREIPIEFEMGSSLVRGSIDYLVDVGTTIAIIDHKTTTTEAAQASNVAGEYVIQLSAYAEAVRRAYPGKVIEVWLHNPDGWMAQVLISSLSNSDRRQA